jgi:hypothetical protein
MQVGVFPDVGAIGARKAAYTRKEKGMAATVHSVRTKETCFLYEAAGSLVPCQREHCSFWLPNSSGCIPERLGLRTRVEEQPELRRRLLALRSEL